MTHAVAQVFTRKTLKNAEQGRQLLELIDRLVPDAFPAKWGLEEPYRRFSWESVPEMWGRSVGWVGRDDGVEGYASPPLASHDRGLIQLTFEYDAARAEAAASFVEQAAVDFEAEFAFLHVPTQRDWEQGSHLLTLGDHASFRDLRTALPYLYWLTIFGPSYVELFNGRLLAAPAHRVEVLAPRLVAVQLTKNVSDCVRRWEAVNEVRRAVVEQLGRDAFFDAARGNGASYVAPTFGRLERA